MLFFLTTGPRSINFGHLHFDNMIGSGFFFFFFFLVCVSVCVCVCVCIRNYITLIFLSTLCKNVVH